LWNAMRRSKGNSKVAARLKALNRAVAGGLKATRFERELTQKKISRQMGWSADVFSNVEKGRRTLTVPELIVLSEMMGEDPEDVFLRILNSAKSRI